MFYFENNSLKFEQEFNFGMDIVLKIYSKITSLSTKKVEEILNEIEYKRKYTDDELVEKKLFDKDNYRKIKKINLRYFFSQSKEIFDLIILKISISNFIANYQKQFFCSLKKYWI